MWHAIYGLQAELGGDPWIARRLYALFSRVDALEAVEVEVRPWTVTARDPERLRPYVDAARLRLACVYAFRPAWRDAACVMLESVGAPVPV